MPDGKQQLIYDLLLRYYDGNERSAGYSARSKMIEFAQEFFYAREIPEMVIRVTTSGEYETPVEGYLWCTSHRLFFAGAKGTVLKSPYMKNSHTMR